MNVLDQSPIFAPDEWKLIHEKSIGNRLIFATWLDHYKTRGAFPDISTPVSSSRQRQIIRALGLHEGVPPDDPNERTLKRHRQEIRDLLGTRPSSVADAEALLVWLQDEVVAETRDTDQLRRRVRDWCQERRVELPSAERVDRIIRSAVASYDDRFCADIASQLSLETKAALDALLGSPDEEGVAPLLMLRKSPGRPSVASVKTETAKLKLVRDIKLPSYLFAQCRPHDVERYRQRAAVEAPYELRRHPDNLRTTLLAAFVHARGQAVTDDLGDVLIETVHMIRARAEKRATNELVATLKRVRGKEGILCAIADAAVTNPDGLVREVVYPVADEQVLQDIVRELKADKATFKAAVRTQIASSYKGHYRRMVPELLDMLEFRSNNARHQPVMDALALVRRHAASRSPYLPMDETVPLDGVVKDSWREAVVETDPQGRNRVLRHPYEICVLVALREKLRCKEIWLVGADRYRNPDEDVPADFEAKRNAYVAALGLPASASTFIAGLKRDLQDNLAMLNAGVTGNEDLRITEARGGRISLTPLDEQPEPTGLGRLKEELSTEYKMTGLLDILKETDLRLGFTDALKSPTSHESLPRAELRPRLLRCIFGHGTNTGLARMAPTGSGVTEKDLRYVNNRYLSVDALRDAIAMVANGTLAARHPDMWGTGTSCASDSKHFGAWDQNLTSQWHMRYGGRGVMIYWHVERKSVCIYSQLKAPSSSEAASMIEGVLRHCTDAEVREQFTDSHGQTEVAFAFTHMLGFDLMPRIKAISTQRLYRADHGDAEDYPHLKPVLSHRVIDWELIANQYDEIIKYATALRLGTASAEAILRRFTRTNVQHPTYRALAELGRVIKTIFLCRYLHGKDIRRQIHEGLNVMEHWNSANDFLFFARKGQMASNQKDDHEVSMLCLHLLQNSMVYINTLMIQRILARPHWQGRLTERDLKALTPLMWEHVNPYGRFDLDMTSRLSLDDGE